MPNVTRNGLKISGSRSNGGMNPPQRPDLNIIEEVGIILTENRTKASQYTESFGNSFKKPGELFLKSI